MTHEQGERILEELRQIRELLRSIANPAITVHVGRIDLDKTEEAADHLARSISRALRTAGVQ